ncbi:hypothetical protein V8E51_007140 [Hyaloscypha variabilis]
MVQLPSFLCSLILSTVSASSLSPRQSTATQISTQKSIENLAMRSNGLLLATNMASSTLYLIDPVAKTTKSGIVVTGASGLSGIGEIAPDVFAVIGGNPGKSVYKVDFSGASPSSSLIATIAGAGNMNGLAVLDSDTVLLGDATKGQIWKLTISTGKSEVAIQDKTMQDPGFGIDGLKYANGTVWYTNLLKDSFYKIPVDSTGKATGTPTAIWTNTMGDDLCFGPNGHVYVSTNSGKNSVVDYDPVAGKESTLVTVAGATSCAFGRTDKDRDTIYIGGSGGVYELDVKI